MAPLEFYNGDYGVTEAKFILSCMFCSTETLKQIKFYFNGNYSNSINNSRTLFLKSTFSDVFFRRREQNIVNNSLENNIVKYRPFILKDVT